MAENTKRLNLEKPAQDDFYNVDVQNNNMEIIDEAFGDLSDAHVVKTYTSLQQIGITPGGETIADIVTNLPDGSILIVGTDASHNMSIYPYGNYGTLFVVKRSSARTLFLYSSSSSNLLSYGNYYSPTSAWSDWIEFLRLDGGTMTGNLKIKHVQPSMELTDTSDNSGSKIHKNAGTDTDYGTYISDIAKDGSSDILILRREGSANADKLMLRIAGSAPGSAAETYRIYGEHNKPTPADIGAVPAAGGNFTGNVYFKRTMSDGTVVATNLFPYNYALNSEFTSNLLHSRDGVSKALLLFNETGAALYDFVNAKLYPLYHSGNLTADTIDALPMSGGTIRSAITFEKSNVNNGSGRIIKNHSASADYGMYISDIDADGDTVKLIVSAKNNAVYFSPADGDSYKLYGEHNKPTASDVNALSRNGGTITGLLNIKDSLPEITLRLSEAQTRFADIYFNNTDNLHIQNRADDDNYISLFLRSEAQADGVKKALRMMVKTEGAFNYYDVYGTHNKPKGTYTGNNSSTKRTISTNGLGNLLMVQSANGTAFVTPKGALVVKGSEISWITNTHAYYSDGTLTLATTNTVLNASSTTCTYYCI